MIDSFLPLLIGIILGIVLIGVGMWMGMRIARRKSEEIGEILSENDREQMVQLLHQLGSWANEYSGNVSDYQVELTKLAEAVQAGIGKSGGSSSDNRVLTLLQQIMASNDNLQSRLDAAERQLEKQTQQLECYLTEARTDGLTGLFNRRAFDKRLEEVFDGYRAGGRSFVIALVDIDKFKVINDSHGHQVGDQVLQQLAATLRSQLGGAIMVARFGGEEFAAILQGPLRVAAERMNEVRQIISDDPIETDLLKLEVTISIGLSEPREDLAVSPVIRRADEALYAAKNIGRNRVYYHDGRTPVLVGAPEVARSE